MKYADTERERQARKMQKAMQQFAELSLNPVFQVLPHPQLFNPLLYAQVYLVYLVPLPLFVML